MLQHNTKCANRCCFKQQRYAIFCNNQSAIQNKNYNRMRYELFKIEKIYITNHNRYDMGDKVVIKKKNLSLI